jgi:hypothetical protein
VAKTALAVAETPEDRPIKQLAPQRCKLAEHVRAHYVVTVEDATHPEDFLQPEFWALVAKDFAARIPRRHHRRRAHLLRRVPRPRVRSDLGEAPPLHEVQLVPPKEEVVAPDFDIQYKGPHLKYCVIRKSDKSIVHEGAASRVDANSWLLGYARTVGAKIAA